MSGFHSCFSLAVLGLRCCTQAFSSCSKWGLLFVVELGLLIAVASLVAEHGLQACGLQQLWHAGSVAVAHGLQSAGSVVVAQGLSCSVACGIFPDQGSMWDLSGPGIEPVCPALAGGFFFFLASLLEYNCFTMLCQFPLYNKVTQLYIYIYPHIPSLLCLPPTLPIPPLQVVTTQRGGIGRQILNHCATREVPGFHSF